MLPPVRSLVCAAAALVLAACGESRLSQLDIPPEAPKPVPPMAQDIKIKIVGSSTVAPFSRTVAEHFGAVTRFPTPVVETTGTGGGFRAFCQGVGPAHPSVTNASRAMRPAERELCRAAGVTAISEVVVGYDGIVLANSRQGPDFNLTKRDIYLGLARDIPDGQGGFMTNPYQRWSEVSPDLPDVPILLLGQPPTSGTRDAFVELAMEPGALELPEMQELKERDNAAFLERAHTVRTDGLWIDLGENDAVIVQSLLRSPEALGLLGFSFLDQNSDRIKGARIGSVEPTFDNIASGDYGLARLLFFYVKDQNMPLIDGLSDYILEFISEGAAGPEGYLLAHGLIPLPAERRSEERQKARALRDAGQRTRF